MGGAQSAPRRPPLPPSDGSEHVPLTSSFPQRDIAESASSSWLSPSNTNGNVVSHSSSHEWNDGEEMDEFDRVSETLENGLADGNTQLEPDKMKVLLLMSETGGGHRASAEALEAAFSEEADGAARINIVDFWVNVAGFPFHRFPQQYAYAAKRPQLWYFLYLWAKFPPTRWLTETAFSIFCHRKVRNYIGRVDPDVIISVHPLINTLSLSCLQYNRCARNKLSPTYVTVVTDLGGAHPTWFDSRADAVYVPSEPLKEEAQNMGYRPDQIRLFGLPIRPSFWTETRSVAELRKDLGLAQTMPAVLLVGGGDGVGGLKHIATAIAERIAEEGGSTCGQMVVICGKNRSLLNSLQKRSWPIPVVLKGFVTNMSEWMAACNVLCSKAGPGTIAEAWIRGLPMILTGFLPGQEEGNVKLVTESGAGAYSCDPEGIAEIAATWVSDPELLASMSARAKSLGRPNASRQIASDIYKLGRKRIAERKVYDRRMAAIAAGSSSASLPNGYFAMSRYYIGSSLFALKRWMMLAIFGRSESVHALTRARE
eukprot:Plantae.Rhodophyta-Hildenbrandia_rubra.ctg8734.p1 GENE.Plantae.Rhodophyta-Hildenbrandia_rubra.ctg8734~~Plantae.Rhodophyta-Hildenbrandia_rubra.ctg8734.p1  ORF type:complete len:561 (-),score=72.61 Plantae.Rhodophyta-Hildenbrandia_rubra.ctg8734:1966-3585(-)